MSETAPLTSSKRRRRWLLALVPLVLLGFGWWMITRPSPLPKFLAQFEDRIHYQEKWRADVTTLGHYKHASLYFVEHSCEPVLRSLIAEAGASRVELLKTGVQCGASSEMGTTWISLMPGVFKGRKGTAVTFISELTRVGSMDQTLVRWFPGWADLRFGAPLSKQTFWSIFVPSSASQARLKEILDDAKEHDLTQ